MTAGAPTGAPVSAVDRVRFRFRKSDELRFLSHHDLMRCFERLLRRSGLPLHRTRGFHPHPRLVFALSLPLGVVGCEEVADLELDDVLPEDELLDRLRRHSPPGLTILSLHRVPLRSSAQVRALCYRLPVPAERVEAVRCRCGELLAARELPLSRGHAHAGDPSGHADRGAATTLDVRPFIRDLRLRPPDPSGSAAVEIDLWLTPAGTARPAEVLGLLGLTDLLEAGAVIERTRLELQEEP